MSNPIILPLRIAGVPVGEVVVNENGSLQIFTSPSNIGRKVREAVARGIVTGFTLAPTMPAIGDSPQEVNWRPSQEVSRSIIRLEVPEE